MDALKRKGSFHLVVLVIVEAISTQPFNSSLQSIAFVNKEKYDFVTKNYK
jgi:hypothetical protein